MKRKAIIVAIIIFYFGLGYLRDFLFVNTNNSIYLLLHPDTYELYYKGVHPFFLDLYNGFALKQLYALKYIYTILFILLYYLATNFSFQFLFKTKEHNKLVQITFFLLTVLGFCSYLLFYEILNFSWGYDLSRFILGLIQTPVITILMLAAIFAFNKTNTIKNE